MTSASSAMRLLSPHVGPIRSLRELLAHPDQPALPAFVAETADMRCIHGCRVRSVSGSALHYDREAAIGAAIGEAIERYCGSALPDDLCLAAATDLGPTAVAPGRFVLFHESQYAAGGFPYRPFLASTRVGWTRGMALPTLSPVHLPAQLVYLDAEGAEEVSAETPIGYATSSGMACSATEEEAVLGGLLELVERDAVMLAWYAQWSPRRLEWRSDPDLAAVEDRVFRSTGLAYLCVDLSDVHGIPTVLALVLGTGVGLALGAASALSPQAAWLKAMREAFATYTWADRLRRTSPSIATDRLHLVRRFEDHVRFYADPTNLPLASFLWRNTEQRDIRDLPGVLEPTPPQQIAAICGRLNAIGASAYAVDLTTADVRRAGLHVYKAVSPELQPLDVGYARRFLGGERLYALTNRLTGRAVHSPADLNPWPHPFP